MTAKYVDSHLAACSRSTPRQRRCLGCRALFASAGPHERICPRCKEGEAWQAGQSEFPCHSDSAGASPARRETE